MTERAYDRSEAIRLCEEARSAAGDPQRIVATVRLRPMAEPVAAGPEQSGDSGRFEGKTAGADGRDHDVFTDSSCGVEALLVRIASAGAICNFCRRSCRIESMQFNDLADHWECKDEVGCAVAGQWR